MTGAIWELVPPTPAGNYVCDDGEDLGGIRNIETGEWVCTFGCSTQYYPSEGSPPNDEDARLILAAPAMLNALKLIHDHGYTTGNDLELVKRSIEAATGEKLE